MNKEQSKVKLRIALSAGGIKGAFQVGFLHEVVNSGFFEIDKVYGCSIGAIIAPFAVNNRLEYIEEICKSIRSASDVYETYPLPNFIYPFMMFFNKGVYKRMKLHNLYDDLTPEEQKIAQSKCHVVAYNYLENKEEWFTGEHLKFGIKCSSCSPLTIPPIEENGKLYVDGAVTECWPLDLIYKEVYANESFDGLYVLVNVGPGTIEPNKYPSDGISFLYNLYQNAAVSNSWREMQRLKHILGEQFIVVHNEKDVLQDLELDNKQKEIEITIEFGKQKGREFVEKYKLGNLKNNLLT
jgi:predicted acylesterase/phospholipase RssA